jgi:putative FmdB family regulatory protein
MTYEYVCEACGKQWEAEQSIKDRPLKKCVSCGEEKAKRLVSGGTGFLLKGGGWYADLYGSPGAAKSGSDDKAGKVATASTKAEGGEAKASTSETKSSDGDKSGSSTASTTSSPATPTTPAASGAKKAS